MQGNQEQLQACRAPLLHEQQQQQASSRWQRNVLNPHRLVLVQQVAATGALEQRAEMQHLTKQPQGKQQEPPADPSSQGSRQARLQKQLLGLLLKLLVLLPPGGLARAVAATLVVVAAGLQPQL